MTDIAFVDCETTHMDAEIGEAWEVAVILREQDGALTTDTEYVWQFAPDLSVADPEALRISRFNERSVVDPECGKCGAAFVESSLVTCMRRTDAVNAIVNVLRSAVLVGSNPGFDDRFLRKLLGPGSAQWHYRPYDIVQFAAAKAGLEVAGPLPWSSRVLSRAVGVEPPTAEAAHTALGDARWARDVYDAVFKPLPAGFRSAVVIAVKCAVCEYEFDEGQSYTVHFDTLDEARQVLRDHGWTFLADGRAVCDSDEDDHHELRGTTSPAKAREDSDREHHQAEINAAINYALNEMP